MAFMKVIFRFWPSFFIMKSFQSYDFTQGKQISNFPSLVKMQNLINQAFFPVIDDIFSVSACDQSFTSTSDFGSKNGTFIAPTFLNPQQHVQQCTFSFVGLPSERVVLEFEEFDLQGTPPECFHEYLDLFTEIQKPKDKSLIETPFGGRYCGKIPPRLRISLYNGLSFVFHSDRPNITEARFSGTFQFMPEGKSILLLGNVQKFPIFLLCR